MTSEIKASLKSGLRPSLKKKKKKEEFGIRVDCLSRNPYIQTFGQHG